LIYVVIDILDFVPHVELLTLFKDKALDCAKKIAEGWNNETIGAQGEVYFNQKEEGNMENAVSVQEMTSPDQVIPSKIAEAGIVEEPRESILLNSRFINFDTCPFCKGVTFMYKEEVLQMVGLTAEQRQDLREKIKAGYDIARLLLHFGAPNLDVETWENSICEKCGSETDWPTEGGQ